MLVLVTGTDTGIGKTVATCSILERAAEAGVNVHGLKPVEAGYADVRDDRSDSTAIVNTLNRFNAKHNKPLITVDQVCLYSFHSPVAAQVAAQHEHRPIEWDKLLQWIRSFDSPDKLVVMEGAGGPLVPITDGKTYADLATELGASAVVVVGSKLGCINHSLLTVELFQRRNIPLIGYIFNELGPAESKESTAITVSRETNRTIIRDMVAPGGVQEIGYIPYLKNRADRGAVTVQPFWKGLLACR